MPRERMDYDVVIVGAGPAGLSAAIRMKQLAASTGRDVNVCVVEKGAEVGSHILSGNVFDPRALNELIPDWKEKGAPVDIPVTEDQFAFLTDKHSIPLPIPSTLHNDGNYIISLGALCKWLATQAEELGVEIYPGFAASELLYDEAKSKVVGIATRDVGIGKDGVPTDNFARGMELHAGQTLLAEGAKGSLTDLAMAQFDLAKDCDPQTYGLGLKEVWEIDPNNHKPGRVVHSIGWPVPDHQTWMGTFLYHANHNQVFLGMVVGLDYANPYISPYEKFQLWKHHPSVANILQGGKCISYGARVINEGGWQSLPKLTFPGGALLGCSAGFLNVPKIKGSHYAIKSGMLAAEAYFDQYAEDDAAPAELTNYPKAVKESWIEKDLYAVRNVHPALHKFGFYGWAAYSGLELNLLKGRGGWTFRNEGKVTDAARTKPSSEFTAPPPFKPDGKISFDLLTNLQRSGVYHEEQQPSHLKVRPGMEPQVLDSYNTFAAPETRFCPAKVYEFVPPETEKDEPKLVINSQNCIHCKTCAIKTPHNYIQWTVPEGSGGPQYGNM